MKIMMNRYTRLTFFLLFFAAFGVAQSPVYSLADTVRANALLKESIDLNTKGKYDEAFAKADTAQGIFEIVLGKEVKEVADVLHQKGRVMDFKVKYVDAIKYKKQALALKLKIYGYQNASTALSLSSIGNTYEKIGETDSAIVNKLNALEIRKIVLGEFHTLTSASYNDLASSYESKGEYSKAIECFNNALNINRKIVGEDSRENGIVYNNLGGLHQTLGQYNLALNYKKKALEILSKKVGDDNLNIATIYGNIGNTYNSISLYDSAIFFIKKSLSIRLKKLESNHPNIAESYNNLGNSYSYLGDYDSAIINFKKALDIRINSLGELHRLVADTYNNLGVVYQDKGVFSEALKYKKKALNIRLKVLDSNHIDIADSYTSIGTNLFSQSRYYESLEFYSKALGLYELNPNLTNIYRTSAYINLGISHRALGNYDKSLNCYSKALNLIKTDTMIDQAMLATLYSNIGSANDLKGEYLKAKEYYEKSMLVRTKILPSNHPDIATNNANIGMSLYLKGEFEEAIKYFNKSIEMKKLAYGNKNPEIAILNNNIGLAYIKLKDYHEAAKYFSQNTLLDYSKISELSLDREIINSLKNLASTYFYIYDEDNDTSFLKMAYEHIQKALSLSNEQRKTSDYQDKLLIVDSDNELYENAIHLICFSIDKNYEQGFEYSEQSKSTLLQSQLKEADALKYAGIPDSLLQKEYDLRIDITWREKQRQEKHNAGKSETDSTILDISSKLFDLRQQYDTLKANFEKNYPDYYRLKYDLSTVPLSTVQQKMLIKDQTLLSYFVGDSSVFAFVVRPDTFNVYEIKKDFPLEQWVKQLRDGLYGYHTAGIKDKNDNLYLAKADSFVQASTRLYQKIITPLSHLLTKEVVIIPDGALGYVPFEALLTEQPKTNFHFKSHKYWGKEKVISYNYSATLWREMREKKHKTQPKQDFVGFAPYYNGDTSLLAGLFAYDETMRKGLDSLRYSGEEIYKAQKLMKGDAILNQNATKQNFVDKAGNYRIVHLATHGKANDKIGDYCFLAFTEQKDSLDNELLYVRDIYNLSLNADMVVLSACETGIGELKRGEGVISLARAFAYAGAKSIVTTLWSVNDQSTMQIMERFYVHLKKGVSKDQALHQAKQDYLTKTDDLEAHPYYWSAFIPIGDMNKIKN